MDGRREGHKDGVQVGSTEGEAEGIRVGLKENIIIFRIMRFWNSPTSANSESGETTALNGCANLALMPTPLAVPLATGVPPANVVTRTVVTMIWRIRLFNVSATRRYSPDGELDIPLGLLKSAFVPTPFTLPNTDLPARVLTEESEREIRRIK